MGRGCSLTAGLLLALLLSTVAYPFAVAAPVLTAPGVTTSRPHYTIDARLDLRSGTLSARQTVSFANSSDEDLWELVFNFTPARNGTLRITGASVDGRPVVTTANGVVFALALPEALPPGRSTVATIDFAGQVPAPGNLRFGRANGVIALGNWYPVLSVYRQGQGWDRHRYVETGDAFVTAVADYNVNLSLAGVGNAIVVAHGGTLVGREGRLYRISAQNVRDFALAASERYVTRTTSVDGTEIAAYFLPEHAAGGAVYLRTAQESFRLFRRLMGDYPYPRLVVAETTGNDPGWVGQEYPTLIMMGSSTTADGGEMGDYLSYVVAHEVAHQWFYGLVGDDQVYEPWLDEAFTTFLGYHYLREHYPAAYQSRWAALKERYRSAAATLGSRPVNSSIYDFGSESHYYAMVYSQGALFLDELRQTLGDESFWQLLRSFVDRYRFRMATGRSFLAMAERQAGRDLDPLFARYFTPSLFASDLDYDVPGGHFYTQANGRPSGESSDGYSVTNEGGVRFWDEFRRLGGVAGVGYPASRRFVWDGFVSQVFQKGVFQWRPEANAVAMVNVFDQISRQGKDDWLRVVRATPPSGDWAADADLAWPEVVRRHQRLLDDNPAIWARYFAVSDPITIYGLPMAPIADLEGAYVLRAQRAIIQQWKTDVPWARAGEVTVANGGDIAKEANLIPMGALRPEEALE